MSLKQSLYSRGFLKSRTYEHLFYIASRKVEKFVMILLILAKNELSLVEGGYYFLLKILTIVLLLFSLSIGKAQLTSLNNYFTVKVIYLFFFSILKTILYTFSGIFFASRSLIVIGSTEKIFFKAILNTDSLACLIPLF